MGKRVLFDGDEREKMSKIIRVQEMIDFFVLSEIRERPMYLKEIDQEMGKKLAGVSANVSYISQRLKQLEEKGFIVRYWDSASTRYNIYSRITEQGEVYFEQLLKDIPAKIDRAIAFYSSLKKVAQKYGHWYVNS